MGWNPLSKIKKVAKIAKAIGTDFIPGIETFRAIKDGGGFKAIAVGLAWDLSSITPMGKIAKLGKAGVAIARASRAGKGIKKAAGAGRKARAARRIATGARKRRKFRKFSKPTAGEKGRMPKMPRRKRRSSRKGTKRSKRGGVAKGKGQKGTKKSKRGGMARGVGTDAAFAGSGFVGGGGGAAGAGSGTVDDPTRAPRSGTPWKKWLLYNPETGEYKQGYTKKKTKKRPARRRSTGLSNADVLKAIIASK